MATLWKQGKSKVTSLEEIREILKPLGVELASWPIPGNPELKLLLAKNQLTDAEKEQILHLLSDRFKSQSEQFGYKTQDLVSLTEQTPKLQEMLAKFDKIHTHSDDEVRYIVDGAGIFGFVLPNEEQVLLKVQAGEYIRVPADTEHWFILDETNRIKAVRYFVSPEGWVANYVAKGVEIAP